MEGDPRRFGRADALEEQWRIFEAALASPAPGRACTTGAPGARARPTRWPPVRRRLARAALGRRGRCRSGCRRPCGVLACSPRSPTRPSPTIELGPLTLRTFGLRRGARRADRRVARRPLRRGARHPARHHLQPRHAHGASPASSARASPGWLTHPDDARLAPRRLRHLGGRPAVLRRLRVRRHRRLPRVPPLEPAHPLAQPRRLRLRPDHRPRHRAHRLLRGRRALRAR